MALSGGSASYYMHSGGFGGSVSETQSRLLQTPPGLRNVSSPGIPAQSNVRGSLIRPTFSVEPPHSNFTHGGISIGVLPGVPSSEPVKKKRGRPRKYGPDGSVSLRLSSMSGTPDATPGSNMLTPKRARGRPPGSGRKQQLATLGNFFLVKLD